MGEPKEQYRRAADVLGAVGLAFLMLAFFRGGAFLASLIAGLLLLGVAFAFDWAYKNETR